jgi:hypothetical protein
MQNLSPYRRDRFLKGIIIQWAVGSTLAIDYSRRGGLQVDKNTNDTAMSKPPGSVLMSLYKPARALFRYDLLFGFLPVIHQLLGR